VGHTFAPRDALKYPVEAILLDAESAAARGGTGEQIDWAVARETVRFAPRLYLAGGLHAANVVAAIRAVRPYGVDVCSGVEAAPGRKDLSRLKDFLAAVRVCTDASS
jgi:phosphoribosylanthranilate isomerase